MNRIWWLLLLFAYPALHAQNLSGDWQGTLQSGGSGLRVVLTIEKAPGGGWAAKAYSIDQGPDPMQVDTLTLEGSHVHFTVKAVGGSYDGELSGDGAAIRGSFSQGAERVPLNFVRATGVAKWTIDPSPHTVRFVPVDRDVKLEVLDWGGTGRTLVLLAGLGNSAHVWDQFAPKLTPKYHVVGITRRGFGASGVPPMTGDNYKADRLGDDVIAVMAALKLDRPVLVGHSIAGEELSSVDSRHPDLVSGLVYLDAGFAYAFYDAARGDFMIDLLALRQKLNQLVPGGGLADPRQVLPEVVASMPQFERDLQRQQEQVAHDPQPPPPAGASPAGPPPPPEPGQAIIAGQQKYTALHGPILAVFAVPHDLGGMYHDDPKRLAAAEAFDAERMGAIVDGFARGVPQAKVVRLKNADHYVFKSNEADVLRDMNAFLTGLP